MSNTNITVINEENLEQVVEKFKSEHPQIAEAMRIFEISNKKYQASLEAVYGPHITWSSSTSQVAASNPE